MLKDHSVCNELKLRDLLTIKILINCSSITVRRYNDTQTSIEVFFQTSVGNDCRLIDHITVRRYDEIKIVYVININ